MTLSKCVVMSVCPEAAGPASAQSTPRRSDFAPLTLEVASTLLSSPSCIPTETLLPAFSAASEPTPRAGPAASQNGVAPSAAAPPHTRDPVPYSSELGRSEPTLWEALCAAEGQGDKPAPDAADAAALLQRLQHVQAGAEAAGRVEPLQRTPKQLRALCRYVRAAAPFASLSEAALINVARSIVMVRTVTSERVVREGDAGSAFFVVLAGTFAVYQRHAQSSPYNTCALLRLRPQPALPGTHARPRRHERVQGACAAWRSGERSATGAHLW